MHRPPSPSPLSRVALWTLAGATLAISAWISDDAFISFRTVDNFLGGHGLTWNVEERVQTYTHPLWLLLNAGLAAFTGHLKIGCLALSMALTLFALWWIYSRIASSEAMGWAAVLLLLLSKSFVDYATSGLENPLTRLLLVLFAWLWIRDHGGAALPRSRLCLLAALATLCRPDALLLFLPCLLAAARRSGAKAFLRSLAVGFSPLIAWAAFSLFYYGTPLPNTAYAKLGLGIEPWRIVGQGFVYLLDSLVRDPVTLATVALATWTVRRQSAAGGLRPLIAGAWLYLGYVTWIGGGFMSGRFLDGPLMLAVTVLARERLPALTPRNLRWAIAALLAALLPRLVVPLLEPEPVPWQVVDERRAYHPFTGLIPAAFGSEWPDHTWRRRGERLAADGIPVHVYCCVGMLGYYAGPEVFLVDTTGVTNPLLARLPIRQVAHRGSVGYFGWRPGHGTRAIPAGYVEGLRSGRNGIEHADLAAYNDALRSITRDPLWNRERLRTVLRFQLGAYDHLLEAYLRDVSAPSESDDSGPDDSEAEDSDAADSPMA